MNQGPFPNPSQKVSPARYAYAVGKVRVLETRLLDSTFLERMIEAPTSEAAFRILNEIPDYQEYIQEGIDPRNFEEMLENQLKKMYLLVDKLFFDKAIIDVFRIRYDFANAKVIIRNLFLEEKKTPGLFGFGIIPPEKLTEAVENRDLKELPQGLGPAIKKALDYFEEAKDPQELDFILDRAWCDHAYLLTKRFPFVNGYLKSFIDLNNTMTFLRCKIFKKNPAFLKRALLDNGRIPAKEFLKLYERPYHELHLELSRRNYLKYIKDGVDQALNEGSLERLAKDADDYLIMYLKKAKGMTFGFEPVFGYMMAKENETGLIRNIMIGKIYDQPLEQIRKGQRVSYV
jgi:V/A-type H+-transporting ATPase subunit C